MYVRPFSQRIVAGTAGTISWSQIGGDGEPADPGTVTVTITRADGTAIVTNAATTGTSTAARTYALSQAQTASLDRLTALWKVSGTTVATTEVDVVAAPWFSNAELRSAEVALENTAKYPAAAISLARLQVESFFETVTGRRFVPGYSYETLPILQPYGPLILRRSDLRTVRSIALYNDLSAAAVETLGATELAAFPPSEAGLVYRYSNGWNATWAKVGYEHGFIAPPPEVKAAAMKLCLEVLVADKSGTIPDNAVTWSSTDLGWSAVLVTPGVKGAHTRLPSVNKVLDEWTFVEVGIA